MDSRSLISRPKLASFSLELVFCFCKLLSDIAEAAPSALSIVLPQKSIGRSHLAYEKFGKWVEAEEVQCIDALLLVYFKGRKNLITSPALEPCLSR